MRIRFFGKTRSRQLHEALTGPELSAPLQKYDSYRNADNNRYLGGLMIATGLPMAGFSFKYRYADTGQQNLKVAFNHYQSHLPQSRAEIDDLPPNSPLYPFVQAAIDDQTPAPQKQKTSYEKGVVTFYPMEGFKKKINVQELTTQVLADVPTAIDRYYWDANAAIAGGLTMAFAGAIILKKGVKKFNALYNEHVQGKTEVCQTPAP